MASARLSLSAGGLGLMSLVILLRLGVARRRIPVLATNLCLCACPQVRTFVVERQPPIPYPSRPSPIPMLISNPPQPSKVVSFWSVSCAVLSRPHDHVTTRPGLPGWQLVRFANTLFDHRCLHDMCTYGWPTKLHIAFAVDATYILPSTR